MSQLVQHDTRQQQQPDRVVAEHRRDSRAPALRPPLENRTGAARRWARTGLLVAAAAFFLLAGALVGPSTGHAAPQRDLWWVETPTATAPVSAASAVSAEATYGHVRALASDIGPRPASGDGYRAAVAYAREQFERLGYRVEVQEFTYRHWEDLGSTVRLDAETPPVRGLALRRSPSGEVAGELVDVGLARTQDLADRSLTGRIALARRGEIPFGQKAENVRAAGAIGLVVYNHERGDLHGQLDRATTIPVLGIRLDEGTALLRRLQAGPTAAELRVLIRDEERPSANVIAEGGPPGNTGRIFVGGHLDSVEVSPGANDNASGSAVVLEMARVFAGRPEAERLTFGLFGAEELGLIGSRRYVEALPPERVQAFRAMVNLDMVGVGERFEIGGAGTASRELVRRTIQSANALGYRASQFDAGGGSDHASFSAANIPAVMLHWRDDPNYHQPTDRPEHVDPQKLTVTARTVAHLIASLLGAEVATG